MSEFGKDINVPSRKGVFIPDITVEMFRNASLEGVEELMANGEMEDISLPSVQPSSSCAHENDTISRQAAIDYFVNGVSFPDEDGHPIEDSDELRKIWTKCFDGIPSAQPDLSSYSDKLWRNAYERGRKDAVEEIIRCKDCKWGDWYTSVDRKRYCYCMETGNGGRTEDDFCSYAERQGK